MMAAANANNPRDLVFAGHHGALIEVLMRESAQAEALASKALELSEKHQFPNEAAISRCVLGAARAQLGHATEGVALLRQGIAGMLESGQRIGVGIFTAFLAVAQTSAGAAADAFETIERALVDCNELVYRPEFLRIRGELRLKLAQTELSESDFRDAIALAQKMGAKALELRAATSLAHLLDKQGRAVEARATLAEIYNWFTEGFDTLDLLEVKDLLDQLNFRPGDDDPLFQITEVPKLT